MYLGMQWPGDEEEKVVARLVLQLLVSFTPVAHPATMPVPAGSLLSTNEAAERRASQQAASTSGRAQATPLRPRSAPAVARSRTAAVLGVQGQELNMEEGADLHTPGLSIRPWAEVGRHSAPEACTRGAQVSFCVEPYHLDSPALQPHSRRHAASAVAPFNHYSTLPQPACIAADRLPPQLASAEQEAALSGHGGQLGLVTGVPVVPLSALQPMLERATPLDKQPDLAAASMSPLASLIQQAERLREAMMLATNPGPGHMGSIRPLTRSALPSQANPQQRYSRCPARSQCWAGSQANSSKAPVGGC